MQASGTSRLGFSTASEFCAANSMPRNAQRVSEILEPMPCASVSPLRIPGGGEGLAAEPEPADERDRPTGMITPQTVIEPMRPVMRGPPKFATVVSHISAMTRCRSSGWT